MSMKLSALLNPSEDTKSMKTTSAPHQSPTTSPVEQQSARRSSSSEVPQTSPVYGSRRDGIQYHQNAFDAASALAALAAGPPAAKSGSIYSESSLLYGVKSDAKSDECAKTILEIQAQSTLMVAGGLKRLCARNPW